MANRQISSLLERSYNCSCPKVNKNKTDPNNYYPISLTSCLCQLFEKMVNKRLMFFLETHNILNLSQCGFNENRSTIDHLVSSEVKKAMDNGQQSAAGFLDLEKAHDRAWRYNTLQITINYGIQGHMLHFL